VPREGFQGCIVHTFDGRYRLAMVAEDVQIPPAVEEYLIGLFSSAGGLGGKVGGGAAGAKGGAKGGAAGAKRLRTRVEERLGRATGGTDQLWRRLDEALPKRIELERPDSDGVRFAVPVGRTGLQQVVVDLEATAVPTGGVDLVMTAYGKEGLISTRPTRRTADEIWAAIAR
jgi:hypothetical protein